MSTPTTLVIPDGVEVTRLVTDRGEFAAHVARAERPRAHVLLVHGWTGSKEDFTPILPLLAAAGYDVTAYDQRGHYETAGDDDPASYSLAALASDAASVASSVTAGPSHLLGHSFGGLVAQTATVEHPTSWRSLSLLCTGPGALGESAARPLGSLVRALDDGISMVKVHRAKEGTLLGTLPPDIEAFKERRFTTTRRAAMRAVTQHLIDAPDRVGEVAATGLPVWVGRGKRDDAWPHGVQDEMAARLGTTVHLVDAAHSPAVENPRGLVEAWRPFLDDHTTPANDD